MQSTEVVAAVWTRVNPRVHTQHVTAALIAGLRETLSCVCYALRSRPAPRPGGPTGRSDQGTLARVAGPAEGLEIVRVVAAAPADRIDVIDAEVVLRPTADAAVAVAPATGANAMR